MMIKPLRPKLDPLRSGAARWCADLDRNAEHEPLKQSAHSDA